MSAPSRPLTEFQRACEDRLGVELASEEFGLTERTLAGESQTYIRALVRDTDIAVYIYEDEAQFHRGAKLKRAYERADFDSPVELQRAFIDGVLHATKDI